MQNCDFNKVALHWLLLKCEPRPWTWNQNTDPENLEPLKPGFWKTLLMKIVWKQLDTKRNIGLPHSIIYFELKFCKKRTLILKNIYEWLSPKMYLVLLFWFLEDNSEVASCRRSTRSTYAGIVKLRTASRIFFNEFCKIFAMVFRDRGIQTFNSKQICLTRSLMLARHGWLVET